MIKKMGIGILLIWLTSIFLNHIYLQFNKDEIYSNLRGKIFYIKREDSILNLYTANADLSKEKLIYSHQGKGKSLYGDFNDNIIDFFYDQKTELIYFVAMKDGEWSLFSIKEGDYEPNFIKHFEKTYKYDFKTGYIQLQKDEIQVIEDKGSLYRIQTEKKELIKKFLGIYDSKFTGYSPVGLSPDGKYLIYYSNGHLTPIGTILEFAIADTILNKVNHGDFYIMDLETKKTAKYPHIHNIQWILE